MPKTAVEAAVAEIQKTATPVHRSPKSSDIRNVATHDRQQRRRDRQDHGRRLPARSATGAITVEEGKSLETEATVVEGMQFDRGFLSPNFVTNADD